MSINTPPRVWHKKHKKYYVIRKIMWANNKIEIITIQDKHGDFFKEVYPKEVILEYPIDLQINGEEVYEGDIVGYEDHKGYYPCEIIWNKNDSAYVGRDLEYRDYIPFTDLDQKGKILGNIHETDKIEEARS